MKKRIIWTVLVLFLFGLAWILSPSRLWQRISLSVDEPQLNAALLDEAIDLAGHYLLHNQRPEGNFVYEYDWRADEELDRDGQVRQAGALWGLSSLYRERPSPELAEAVERGLSFFGKHSRWSKGAKRRWVTYPGAGSGRAGTTALMSLALIEYLRARPELKSRYEPWLRAYLKSLLSWQNSEGLFHQSYQLKNGQGFGPPSSYFDGEILLALVKAARYLGPEAWLPKLKEAADVGHRINIQEALKRDGNSNITKGYFQWSAMAFYELATSGWPDTARYGDHLLFLADWMIEDHHTLWCTRNTAYAYEGMIHAYDLAQKRGLKEQTKKLAAVIDIGLSQLSGWQVGHSLADGLFMGSEEANPRALGGVQNSWIDPILRIDVVQHQLHALLLARRYLYR